MISKQIFRGEKPGEVIQLVFVKEKVMFSINTQFIASMYYNSSIVCRL